MSKTKLKRPENSYVEVDVAYFDYLLGKLFSHTELLGLSDRQLTAYKSTVRQMFWDWYNRLFDNPTGLADPSKQLRIDAGIEPNVTVTSSSGTYVKYSS